MRDLIKRLDYSASENIKATESLKTTVDTFRHDIKELGKLIIGLDMTLKISWGLLALIVTGLGIIVTVLIFIFRGLKAFLEGQFELLSDRLIIQGFSKPKEEFQFSSKSHRFDGFPSSPDIKKEWEEISSDSH